MNNTEMFHCVRRNTKETINPLRCIVYVSVTMIRNVFGSGIVSVGPVLGTGISVGWSQRHGSPPQDMLSVWKHDDSLLGVSNLFIMNR